MSTKPLRILDPLGLAGAEAIAYEESLLVRIPMGGVINRTNIPSIPAEADTVGYCAIPVRRLSHTAWGRVIESASASPYLAEGARELLLDLLATASGGEGTADALLGRLMTGTGMLDLLLGAVQLAPELVTMIVEDALHGVPGVTSDLIARLTPEQLLPILEGALEISFGSGAILAQRYFQHARQRFSSMRSALVPSQAAGGQTGKEPRISVTRNSTTGSAKKGVTRKPR